jgi:hypothetical protein
MQQKITFSNQQSYSDTKDLHLNNNQNPSTHVNFTKPINTTRLDYRNNQDQSIHKVQNVNPI